MYPLSMVQPGNNLILIIEFFIMDTKVTSASADPEILKRGSAQSRRPWLADEEYFRFQIV